MPPDPVVPPFDADNDIVHVESTDGTGFPAIRAFCFPTDREPDSAGAEGPPYRHRRPHGRHAEPDRPAPAVPGAPAERCATRTPSPTALAWPYTVRDRLEKPTADATVTEWRITDGPTGPESSKAAPDVDHAAPMGVPDDHMPCIEAVCPKGHDAAMSQAHAPRQQLPVKRCQTPVTPLKGPV